VNGRHDIAEILLMLILILPFLSLPPVFSGVRVTRSLVLYICFVDHWLSFCTFSFRHCVVCSSSIYGFWLPLWYLQTLLSGGYGRHDIAEILLMLILILPFAIYKVCFIFIMDVIYFKQFSLYCRIYHYCLDNISRQVLSTKINAIVLSVLLRYTDSDCPFGIFKLFLVVDEAGVPGENHRPWTSNW
jgi:hypothetical protein